ncbi:MAG: hypothetical protein ACLPM8_06610 [Myxococcaceae bacterium]
MLRLLVCLCFLFPVVAFSDDGVDAGAAAAPVSGVAQLDVLWTQRDAPGVQEQLLALTEEGVKAHPEDFAYLWRAARIRLWAGDAETDNEKKKALGQTTWDLGDRAARAKPGAVEGYYFAAAGIGSYSQAVGILNALGQGLESKFNERLDKAINIDPRFAHAGPLAVKGRYYFELPWPKRNLGKSADWLNRAIKLDPNALRAMAWLAETQWRDGNSAAARETLARLAKGSIPDDPAEERRSKAMGVKIGLEMDKEH